MKAVQATMFGAPSVLMVKELPDPIPGPGEISIDVTHSAVGLVDVYLRQGLFKEAPGMAQPPFIPGLEVAGKVRALGAGATGFAVGERVVSMSAGTGTGGYASVYIAKASHVISIESSGIDPALAVAVIPNAAMAHVAMTKIARLREGESVLIHGALGGFAAAFPGIATHLGASRVVGTVRSSKLDRASDTKLPYHRIVDSDALPAILAGEQFDVIIDPVGGTIRSLSPALMRPGSRLIVLGNASGDWTHQISTNDLWLSSTTVSGFNAGAYLSKHPELIRPALEAALQVVVAGLGNMAVDVLPLSEAAIAHERMESRALDGRIVLSPQVL